MAVVVTRRIRAPLTALAFSLAAVGTGSSQASTTTYSYDANGRLVSSTRTVGLTEQYGFDNADNRSTLNTSRQGAGNTPTVAHQAAPAAAQPVTPSARAAPVPAQTSTPATP